jgi:hypothetical protein
MQPFDITILIEDEYVTLTVIPSDNGENDYSSYFELLKDNQEYCHVKIDEENIWQICKGPELSKEELKQITDQIETSYYKKCG